MMFCRRFMNIIVCMSFTSQNSGSQCTWHVATNTNCFLAAESSETPMIHHHSLKHACYGARTTTHEILLLVFTDLITDVETFRKGIIAWHFTLSQCVVHIILYVDAINDYGIIIRYTQSVNTIEVFPQSHLGRASRYSSWQRMLSPELSTLIWK